MQIYYASLDAISQHTMQLDHVQCIYCGQSAQLVSHGFIYKKQAIATMPKPVGKRVLCSRRFGHTGCGRTVQLYLDSMVRHLHCGGCTVVAFVLSLMQGLSIALAYRQVSGAGDARHAYRWLNKLFAQLSTYRSVVHQVPFDAPTPGSTALIASRRHLIIVSFVRLLRHFRAPLCASFQKTLQTSFL